MGVDAIVVLPVAAAAVEPYTALPLRDGCRVLTGVRFGRDPAALGRALRRVLGDVWARGADRIYVYPDTCEPRADTVAGLVTELGDAGVWCPRDPPPAVDPLEALGDRVTGDLLSAFHRAAASGDLGAARDALGAWQRAFEAIPPEEQRALVARLLPPRDEEES